VLLETLFAASTNESRLASVPGIPWSLASLRSADGNTLQYLIETLVRDALEEALQRIQAGEVRLLESAPTARMVRGALDVDPLELF
jgi:hypothetical protein